MTTGQRILFGIMTFIVVTVVGTIFYWATRPDYALLFASLSPNSAQKIVEELKTQNIVYTLNDGGSSIYVPRKDVYDLRLKFASTGAANSDFRGYELFDNNTLGMTDFMQRVNLKRALEGELSRTISSLDQVERARVHLVLPERSPFTDTNVEASASVILNILPASRLSQAQIEGISSLVASSVEELNTENVTILDQKGNKISTNETLGGDYALSNGQLKIKQQAEQYLMQKGQSMLDRVLGAGNAILRVSTNHDFEKLKRDSELIDPESRIIISEEQRTERVNDVKNDPLQLGVNDPPALRAETIQRTVNDQSASVRIRNYEVNTTREQYEKPVGEITRMSVSVLLNHKRQKEITSEGRDSIYYIPYTAAEIRNINQVIATALGVDIIRGDEINVTQVLFDNTLDEKVGVDQILLQDQLIMNEWIKWGLLLLGLIATLFIIYGIVRRVNPNAPPLFFDLKPELENGKADAEKKSLPKAEENEPKDQFIELEGSDVYQRKLSPEAQRRLKMKSKMFDEVKNFTEFKSDEAVNLVRSMMVQEKK